MPLMDYADLIDFLDNEKFDRIIEKLPQDFLTAFNHGDFDGWVSALQELPDISPTSWDLQKGVAIGEAGQCNDGQREQLKQALLKLQPWRKGPFDMFGLDMDTEWRSDWKWDRLKDHISPLENRNVLDIGCGNGYHCWRMAGAGARFVLGVDSHLLFTMQYWAIRHFLKEPPVFVVPAVPVVDPLPAPPPPAPPAPPLPPPTLYAPPPPPPAWVTAEPEYELAVPAPPVPPAEPEPFAPTAEAPPPPPAP